MKHFTLLVLMTFVYAGCSDSIPEEEVNIETIFPGTGITSIDFGDTAQTVFETFGNVSARSSAWNNGYRYFLDYPTGMTFVIEEGTTEELDANLKVIGIILEAPFEGKTNVGIGVGSTKSDVIAAYMEPDSDIAFMVYNDLGMTLSLEDDLVDAIQIKQ